MLGNTIRLGWCYTQLLLGNAIRLGWCYTQLLLGNAIRLGWCYTQLLLGNAIRLGWCYTQLLLGNAIRLGYRTILLLRNTQKCRLGLWYSTAKPGQRASVNLPVILHISLHHLQVLLLDIRDATNCHTFSSLLCPSLTHNERDLSAYLSLFSPLLRGQKDGPNLLDPGRFQNSWVLVAAGTRPRNSCIARVTGVACVTGISGITSIARVTGISGITGIARISGITSIACVARISGITSIACVARISGITSIARVARISGITSIARVTSVTGIARKTLLSALLTHHAGQQLQHDLHQAHEQGQHLVRATRLSGDARLSGDTGLSWDARGRVAGITARNTAARITTGDTASRITGIARKLLGRDTAGTKTGTELLRHCAKLLGSTELLRHRTKLLGDTELLGHRTKLLGSTEPGHATHRLDTGDVKGTGTGNTAKLLLRSAKERRLLLRHTAAKPGQRAPVDLSVILHISLHHHQVLLLDIWNSADCHTLCLLLSLLQVACFRRKNH